MWTSYSPPPCMNRGGVPGFSGKSNHFWRGPTTRLLLNRGWFICPHELARRHPAVLDGAHQVPLLRNLFSQTLLVAHLGSFDLQKECGARNKRLPPIAVSPRLRHSQGTTAWMTPWPRAMLAMPSAPDVT